MRGGAFGPRLFCCLRFSQWHLCWAPSGKMKGLMRKLVLAAGVAVSLLPQTASVAQPAPPPRYDDRYNDRYDDRASADVEAAQRRFDAAQARFDRERDIYERE